MYTQIGDNLCQSPAVEERHRDLRKAPDLLDFMGMSAYNELRVFSEVTGKGGGEHGENDISAQGTSET